jgi:hypothetical protein
MPQIPYSAMIEYAKRNNVDYIVAWDKEIAGDKDLSIILDPKIPHPGLKELYKDHTATAQLTIFSLK